MSAPKRGARTPLPTAQPAALAAALPDVGGGSLLARVFAGARAVFGGVRVVFSDAKLLSLSFVPMLVHVGLFALFLWLGFTEVVDPLLAWLTPANGTDGANAAGTDASPWASALAGIIHVIVVVVVVVAALVATVMAGSVVCDPFYDLLSERTEELFVGRNVGPPFSAASVARGVVRELFATVLRLLVWGAVAVPLWILSFTPAAVVATPLSFVWTWLFFAYEYVSRSLARHAIEPKHRFKPIFAHKAVFVGFGAMAWVGSFLPFIAPFLVVGATRLYLALAAFDRAPSQLTDAEKLHLKTEK